MFWVLAVLYIVVGSVVMFFYKYECMKDYDSRWNDHEDDTTAAVFPEYFGRLLHQSHLLFCLRKNTQMKIKGGNQRWQISASISVLWGTVPSMQ